MRPRRCQRPACGQPLTAKQIGRGQTYCSRACFAEVRRVRPRSTRSTCRACSKALSRRHISDGAAHCSIRCAMRTRHGRPSPTVTACAWCDTALTRRQRWRRRTYCSRACAKAAEWKARPEIKRRAVAASMATQRRRHLERLRAFLQACPDRETAGARGWFTGWSVAARRVRQSGVTLRYAHRDRRGRIAEIAASAASRADAYRRCYAAAYAFCWQVYTGRTPAAA